METVDAEEGGEEESGESSEQNHLNGVQAESEHEEDGAGDQENGLSRESQKDDGEEAHSMNPPAAVVKDRSLEKMIREVQKATLESLEYIKSRVEGDEPDSFMVMRAKESIHELENHIEKLYELLCEKEDEEDE